MGRGQCGECQWKSKWASRLVEQRDSTTRGTAFIWPTILTNPKGIQADLELSTFHLSNQTPRFFSRYHPQVEAMDALHTNWSKGLTPVYLSPSASSTHNPQEDTVGITRRPWFTKKTWKPPRHLTSVSRPSHTGGQHRRQNLHFRRGLHPT